MKTIFCTFLILILGLSPFNITDDYRPFLLLNATIHLGNGERIPNGAIAFDREQILFSGDSQYLNIETEKFQKLQVNGLHVYPFEILPLNGSESFIKEYANLISLHSSADSTCTARVFHNQLGQPYTELTAKANFVVIDQEWGNKKPFKILYVFSEGNLVKSNVPAKK